MEQDTLQRCQELIGYQFSDPEILRLALTHSSVAPTRAESNERLEFLGDSVLGLAVCHELYDHKDDLMEGEMTKVKSAVVSRRTCAEIVEELGLLEMVSLGKGLCRPGGAPKSVAAATFESVLGAVYLDGGIGPAFKFALAHLRPRIKETLACQHRSNYKAILQQFAQHEKNAPPEYHLLDEKGPDHSKCFEVAVCINGKHFPSAWGITKKDAEQRAAERALVELGIIDDE